MGDRRQKRKVFTIYFSKDLLIYITYFEKKDQKKIKIPKTFQNFLRTQES